MKRSPIRLVVADDHGLVREGLIGLLEREPDIKVVAEVERADDLKKTLETTHCDILLLDLKMDRLVLSEIPALARITKVVVLTASDELEDLAAAFRAGARAIVQKTSAADTLTQAIQAVASGAVWIPPALQKKLSGPSVEAERLTTRETEIVRYVAVGLRNAEVAEKLSITKGTVKIHLNNIFQKLNVRDRVELTLYAIRRGLVGASEPRR